jgi:hypothetical protein
MASYTTGVCSNGILLKRTLRPQRHNRRENNLRQLAGTFLAMMNKTLIDDLGGRSIAEEKIKETGIALEES